MLCIYLFMALLAGGLVAAPWLVRWLQYFSYNATAPAWMFLATLYLGGALAALLLYHLYRLLHNINQDQVFIEENVKRLRIISWLCIWGGLVALVSSLYYLPWLFVAAAAAFVGLIVRVVKNIIAQAIEIKQENDFTI